MKSVTEFPSFSLNDALKAKTALVAEGKSAEEIQQGLSVSFKIEGDKLKHFVNAIEVAGQNQAGLKRVLVLTLAEGEAVPAKSTKIEEFVYVPEFHVLASRVPEKKIDDKRGGGGRGGKGQGGGGQGRGGR